MNQPGQSHDGDHDHGHDHPHAEISKSGRPGYYEPSRSGGSNCASKAASTQARATTLAPSAGVRESSNLNLPANFVRADQLSLDEKLSDGRLHD